MRRDYSEMRRDMVTLIKGRGVSDPIVISAMGKVKRHLFFPPGVTTLADPYGDHPLEIGFGQTISQPYIVAYMLEKLSLRPGNSVLEIGTGSGYQAAVLFEMGMEVFTIESVKELYEHSKGVLDPEVHIRCGDGWQGWPEEAPFDGIVLSCAPDEVPEKLVSQLAEGGRMILPVGGFFQRLVLVRKERDRVTIRNDLPVRFVPMVRPTR